MSKIFDALQGSRSEVSDLLPSLFDDDLPPPHPVLTTPVAVTAAAEAVIHQVAPEQPVLNPLVAEKLVAQQPVVELPRVAPARVESPRVESPKVEQARVELHRVEPHRVEQARVVQPTVELPGVQQHRAEQGRAVQPAVELPGVAQHRAEQAPLPQSANGQPAVAQAVAEPLTGEPAKPGIAPESPQMKSRIRRLPLVVGSSEPLLPFENQEEPAAEQYRIARTKLAHHPKNPKMIVISSASSGDGKSFTAINLAGVLSLKGDSKVLLLDGDFRRSSMHSRLGLPSGPGLAEVITGECAFEDAVIQADQFPNLYIMVRGDTKTINPSELLDSPGWRSLCKRTRQEFEYIIVDSPPVAAVADFELIQVAADGTILVVRPEHTKRSACLKAIDTIPKDKFLGVMLNCAEDWLFSKHSSYGYGYGYADKPSAARERKLA